MKMKVREEETSSRKLHLSETNKLDETINNEKQQVKRNREELENFIKSNIKEGKTLIKEKMETFISKEKAINDAIIQIKKRK